jgi:hypothetical protein
MFDSLDGAVTETGWTSLIERCSTDRANVVRELRAKASRTGGLSNEELDCLGSRLMFWKREWKVV